MRAEEVGEQHALFGQPIQVRAGAPKMAVAGEPIRPRGVQADKNDVGHKRRE